MSFEDELAGVEAYAIQQSAKLQAMELMYAYFRGGDALNEKMLEFAQRDESYSMYGMIFLLANMFDAIADATDTTRDEVMAGILQVLNE